MGQICGGADPTIGPYNDVNLIYNNEYTMTKRDDLGITSLSATCLNLLGFDAPEDYLQSVLEFT